MNLFGVYEGTADAKGRIMLPGAFKKQLEKVIGQGFIIKRSIYSKSLELYPMSTWNNRTKALKTLNPFLKKNVEFNRLFNYGVQDLQLDANNRFLIMKELTDFAGIKKDVVLAASVDFIEIWDAKAYNKFIKENSDNFEKLTEEVMGNYNPSADDK